uniref:Uncharacterized protein n=1 Tax=Mucochytrium quahogii TaxID=96639 RepID=A0A7S2R7X1_9STRA
MDELLNAILGETETVRSEGVNVLDLMQRVLETSTGTDAEKYKQLLNSFEEQELRVRSVLECIHLNICEFEKKEHIALSGEPKIPNAINSNEMLPSVSKLSIDAEAARAVATKGISRDIAHSFESEASWRKTAYSRARKAEHHLCTKTAFLFPSLRNSKGIKKGKRGTRSRNADKQPQKLSLEETLRHLKGLKTFETVGKSDDMEVESGENKANTPSTLSRLTCLFHNGLDLVVEFSPTCPRPIQNTSSDRGQGINLDGLRVSWVEVSSRKMGNDDIKPSTTKGLVRDLSIRAQQRQFELAKQFGEYAGLCQLLEYVSAEIHNLSTAPVVKTLVSPMTIETSRAK